MIDPSVVSVAAVRAMRPEEGERPKAFVVPSDGAPVPGVLRALLDRFVDERLSPAERPRAWTFGPCLPADDRGKASDRPIDRGASPLVD